MKKLIKNPVFYIPVIGMTLMYGPGVIARTIQGPEPEPEPSEIIWNNYCHDNGIDPDKATEEQKNEYYDVYMETDEYQELFEALSRPRNSLQND